MLKNIEEVLSEYDFKEEGEPGDEPCQVPVTIRDLEVSGKILDMQLPMADPCPDCGAVRMQVGDWVCYGSCGPCEEARMKKWEH